MVKISQICFCRTICSIKTLPKLNKLTFLIYEAYWLFLVIFLIYLISILLLYVYSYSIISASNITFKLHNYCGYIGIFLANFLLSIFGISVLWWCIFLANIIIFSYQLLFYNCPIHQQIKYNFFQKKTLIRIIGFIFLLISSTGIEYTYSIKIQTLYIPGGILGEFIGNITQVWLGLFGTTLLFFLLFNLGLSLFFQFSIFWIIYYLSIFFKKSSKLIKFIYFFITKSKKTSLIQNQKKFLEEKNHKINSTILDVQSSLILKSERTNKNFYNINSCLPPLSLLDKDTSIKETISKKILNINSRIIEKKMLDFGIKVKVIMTYPGPLITCYAIELAAGIKGKKIVCLAQDLARSLSISTIRVVETIPGKNYMGLELPNAKRQIIRLIEILQSKNYNDSTSNLTVVLGKNTIGKPVVIDIEKMPHLLIAGMTGSGKSMGINAIILSLLYKFTIKQVRFILIDPKMLELSIYEDIPHLLVPVITDMRKVNDVLNWAITEMERRYKYMLKLGVRNIIAYNRKITENKIHNEQHSNFLKVIHNEQESLEQFANIIIIIDELADLMITGGKKIEELIIRIAQKSRAAGIHLILATQRPSVDIITGLIKANIPARIAFQVSSKIDSRVILDQAGAETLLGMGDMLYMPSGISLPIRVHSAFVSDEEIYRVVNYLKLQKNKKL